MATLGVGASGQTFFSGYISGIDTQSLIENAVNARLLPRKRLDDRVTANTSKITGYQKLQTQSNALKASFDKLKSDLTLPNTFRSKAATYASSNPAVTPASVLSVTAGSTAQSGIYDVVVGSVAKAFAAEGTNQGSITTDLNATGSFDIGQAGKTAATINIVPGDTIQNLASKINATTSTSGVSADILQVAPGQYRLVIRGQDTNQAVTVSNLSGDNVLNSLGVTDGGGAFTNVTSVPSPASITINGSVVTSDSNIFSNVLTGVTINVASASPATTITVKIDSDTSAVKAAIQSIVDNYNALRKTIAEYQTINPDGTVPETSLLYNESLASSLKQAMSNLVTGTYGDSTTFNGLRSLGVSIDSTNNLVIDSTVLDGALKNNFADVQKVFETNGPSIGLADTASEILDSFSNVTTGSIQIIINNFQTTNIDLKKKSEEIKESVGIYQTELINRYAKLEAYVQAGITMKKQIQAILDGSTPTR